MPTTSVRLPANIRKAVRESDYTLSELAREGIEQTVIDDLVSVCWVCGGGIHKKEKREILYRQLFNKKIVSGELKGYEDRPVDPHEHSQLVEFENKNKQQGVIDRDYYFERVADWLNLPEKHEVEFCSSCAEYLDQIREKNITPSDIPIPYYYRSQSNGQTPPEPAHVPERPEYHYAAEVMAVYLANYFCHQRVIFNEESLSREDRQRAPFWWAARARNERIISTDLHPWAEIAVWSHGESLMTGKPLERVYSHALQMANEADTAFPTLGIEPPVPAITLDDIKVMEDECPACGGYCGTSDLYCDACLFSNITCNTEGCDLLHPQIRGKSLIEQNIKLSCEICGRSESPPEEYAEALCDKYQPIFDKLERTIPFDNQNL
ncbi:hypothetical protein AArcCO_4156 (plasmid) [Halalkaliarchaeum sp. AArc-CO]|uniref:hypothetical protein n=1 Tax=Halalkaliarchaeum sp. AArc-CO TaxID=2866381 RepID=UPI00217E1C9F|nr:hypothetical protein [Halalkaliarchaeum sp. AArc-CO]UWG49331.1 hypothetical protein AArcCO_4156 [Halalkaliarchaeum sp. AArc-CO]